MHSALPSGHWCVSQRPHSAINGQVKTAWLAMLPDPSEMSRTSVVRSILDISDGSGKDQPRAVKMVSADSAPRPLSSAKVSVRGRKMHPGGRDAAWFYMTIGNESIRPFPFY